MIKLDTLSRKLILVLISTVAAFHSLAQATDTDFSIHPATIVSDRFLMGKFSASKRNDFVRINKRYASRTGMYMQKLPYDAFRFFLLHEAFTIRNLSGKLSGMGSVKSAEFVT